MKNKQFKPVFGSLFRLERNKYCSTFTINIESSRIPSMNMFTALQENICSYPVLAVNTKEMFLK